MSRAASSRSSVSPGTVVGGFRVERLVGRGSLGAVYEATQVSLDRTVALRLLDAGALTERLREQQRVAASLHHPNLVATYECGAWDEGAFIATRFVRGRTLDTLLAGRPLPRARWEALLDEIAGALDTAHAAGLVHGRLTARNVLVDDAGTPFLTDLGLGRAGSVEDDRASLARLAALGARRRRRLVAPVLAVAAVVAGAVVLAPDGDGGTDAAAQPPPPVAAAAVPLGSALGAGVSHALGCADRPGPNTPACTLSQAALGGRLLTVRRAGVIRRWAVRGASGDLALQVIARGGGRTYLRGFSQLERVANPGPHAFAASIPVQPGDRIGVLLAPGAVLGARPARHGTSAVRWEGTLDFAPASQDFERLGEELLVRADVEYGARPETPPQRTGAAAARAPAGRRLARTAVELARRSVRVELVEAGGAVALDAFRGERRRARIAAPDLRPGGRVLSFDGHCGYRRGVCLRWINPGETSAVVHAYRLVRGGSAFRLIG
jgi:hypothetical protein